MVFIWRQVPWIKEWNTIDHWHVHTDDLVNGWSGWCPFQFWLIFCGCRDLDLDIDFNDMLLGLKYPIRMRYLSSSSHWI